jgi:citrate synthase
LINDQYGATVVVSGRLSTAEAAAALGVKPATLYAYVSRGLLSRQRTSKGSTFDATEVTRLAATHRRAPQGSPRLDLAVATAITLIEGGRLAYRGRDAVELAGTHRFEEVAGWLWSAAWEQAGTWGCDDGRAAAARRTCGALDPAVRPADRMAVAVAAAGSVDPLRADLHPRSVASVGRDLISITVDVLVPGAPPLTGGTVAARLWSRLSPLPPEPARVAVLDAALVLLADHELAASTLAARVAAAFGADPYAVVSTGLGALSGRRHGAMGDEVVGLLAEVEQAGSLVGLGARLARHERLPGFGMVLYPDGDPRARAILARLEPGIGDPGRRAVVTDLLGLGAARGLPTPNVDLALGALAFEAVMVPGAAHAVMAVARTAGWLAHAMEEYAAGTTFRARATYVGERSASG